jgi:hypothetical protein
MKIPPEKNARLRALEEQGIPVSPEPSFSICNIEPHSGGEDFLRAGLRADLVPTRWVQAPCVPCYDGSPDAEIPHAWHDSAEKTGARALRIAGSPFRHMRSYPGFCNLFLRNGFGPA